MKLLLALAAVAITSSAFASLGMKPGKWRMQTKMTTTHNGKTQTADPMAKMNEAMKNMTPEQRKQMQQMMGNISSKYGGENKAAAPKVGFDEKGMTVCYTEEMLKSGLNMKEDQEKQKCKVTDYKTSATEVSMNFKCENGSSGRSEWHIKDDTHMDGFTRTTTAKGEKHEIKYKAEYLGKSC